MLRARQKYAVPSGMRETWTRSRPGVMNAAKRFHFGQAPLKRAKRIPDALNLLKMLPAMSMRIMWKGIPEAPARLSVVSRWHTCSKPTPNLRPTTSMSYRSSRAACRNCRLPNFFKTGRWVSGMRAMDRNVPRTRSVERPARGAQNPRRPRTREPGAPTAARPAPPSIKATAIRAPRSRLLVVALQPVVWVAPGAPSRTPRDRHSLAPAGLPRFLDLEVPSRASGSTTGRLGDCGTRAHHGARESALGRATHPRRIAQARF